MKIIDVKDSLLNWNGVKCLNHPSATDSKWSYDLPNGGHILFSFVSKRYSKVEVLLPMPDNEKNLGLCETLGYGGDCSEMLGYFTALARLFAQNKNEDCWIFVNHLFRAYRQPR